MKKLFATATIISLIVLPLLFSSDTTGATTKTASNALDITVTITVSQVGKLTTYTISASELVDMGLGDVRINGGNTVQYLADDAWNSFCNENSIP